MGEHAAGVPGWECPDRRREAIELDAAIADGLRPGELPGVPLDEGFGLRRHVEILVEALVRLADHETQAHGLATTGGIVSHTGVGGPTLGGGGCGIASSANQGPPS